MLPKEILCTRLSGFSSLACNGSRLVRANRKRNSIAGAGFEKCFDIAVGEKRLVPEEFRDEGGFCKLFDSFHSTKGSEKIGAGRDHTVIGHEDGVVVRHKSSERFAKLRRAWCGVLSQRDTTEQDDDFWEHGFVQSATGSGKAGGDGRMGVTDGANVGAEAVEEKMHAQFRGRFSSAGELVSFEVGDDKVFGRHLAFADPARCREEPRAFEPYRKIALRPNGETPFVKPACGDAKIAP
jgi:hypothetical protein